MLAVSDFESAQILYRPKIETYSKKVWRFLPGYEQDDLEGELLEVLWKCTLRYHPDNGANFNTFFWRSAKNRTISIERHLKALRRSAKWVQLDPEAFVIVCDQVISEFSAEEFALANLSAKVL